MSIFSNHNKHEVAAGVVDITTCAADRPEFKRIYKVHLDGGFTVEVDVTIWRPSARSGSATRTFHHEQKRLFRLADDADVIHLKE